jgi:hypothetical protein
LSPPSPMQIAPLKILVKPKIECGTAGTTELRKPDRVVL